ncbi:Glycosyltransferase [Quillaja saponaria]|uniref:Glycosyltransferase n=1 Tax=Quillaja saponaria TaxID=32244 RepID=A0AAD7PZD3_QUISA|nr:Glycosyltransferase [Quillaja saponaria]
MRSETLAHVLLVSFPSQGHINPLLRLGKRLAAKGLLLTFSTTQKVGKDMQEANDITDKAIPIGDGFLQFEFFEDGWTDDEPKRKELSDYLPQLELVGKQMISGMIKKYGEENRPVSCIINNPFIPWVCDVANEHGIPSAMLWVQSCAVFAAYYHYLHKLVPFPSNTEPHMDVQLPSMPLFKYNEIPDFLHPSSSFQILGTVILEQLKNLSIPFCILMDTFHELEHEIIDYMSNFFLIKPVGPLVKNPQALNAMIRGDCLKVDHDCIEWLNSKPQASVVYISFGSVVYQPQEQIDEIAYGLLHSQVSFLWVLKPPPRDSGLKLHVLPDGFSEKTKNRGKVVQWSPQEEVLAHPSVAAFLTHCGWNSSVEALTSGVPVLTFPAWGDQVTNAKFLVDVFCVGIRLGHSQDENKLITRDEVSKCLLEATVGPKAVELKQNALKWKMEAEAAMADGGSSDQNLLAFVQDIKSRTSTVYVKTITEQVSNIEI